jgi:drug/metabolite transporter (DMT)-like permease
LPGTCRSDALKKLFSTALVLLLLLGTLRGGATSISKYVVISDIPPLAYSMWQSFIVALLLLPMGYARSRQMPPLWRERRYFVVCAVIGVAIPNVVFFYVVQTVPAGSMAVLLTLAPIVTYTLVVTLGMERFNLLRVLGIGLGFGGALMIALPRLSGAISINWWVIIGLLCPLGYASMSVFISRYPLTGYHLFLLVGGTHLVAFLFLLPITLASGNLVLLWEDPGLVQALIVVHGFIAAAAYSMFFKIVELAGPVFYSFSTYIIAVNGIFWGWIVFAETHPPHFWLAVASIFIGLAIINYRRAGATVNDKS